MNDCAIVVGCMSDGTSGLSSRGQNRPRSIVDG